MMRKKLSRLSAITVIVLILLDLTIGDLQLITRLCTVSAAVLRSDHVN